MQRLIIFLYGVIVYAFFFVVFCYAPFFVTGLLVPKTIDSGAAGPLLPALLINALLLGAFAIQHMIMARPWFKRWWTRIIPPAAERSTFVLAATALLALLFVLWQPIPIVLWDVQQPIVRAALYAIAFLGFGIVLYSSFLIDHFDLFGLRQVVLELRKQPYTHKPFVERSLYKIVRHPLMLGFLILFWFTPFMTVGHLQFALLTTGYIFIGVMMEERDLIRQHGEKYLQYKRRVSGIVPLPRAGSSEPAPQTSAETGSV